jgi:S-DNA-T family DNA segregation ATPase FtsK/SpoIIIE
MNVPAHRGASRLGSVAIGIFLLLVAAACAVSLMAAFLGGGSGSGSISVPGAVLFAVYGFSSFLIPLYVLAAALILFVPGWTFRSGILFAGSALPFFTIAVAEYLARKYVPELGGVGILVGWGIALSSLLAVAVEYILLAAFADFLVRPAASVNEPYEAPEEPMARRVRVAPLELSAPEAPSAPLAPSAPEAPGEFQPQGEHEALHEAETPTYVDFQTMKAPFDLPVIEEWTGDSAGDASDADAEAEIDPDYESDVLAMEASEGLDADEREDLALIDDDLPPVISVPPQTGNTPVPGEPSGGTGKKGLFSRKRRGSYSVPFDILTSYPDGEYWLVDDATRRSAAALKDTLNEFRIQADVTGIRKGPVITMFEILPAPGVKLSRIVSLQDNIALRLAASSVRIVAPIPGKHAVGIEVPNQKRAIVSFRELIEGDNPAAKKMEIPVVLGKDITGEAQIIDLAATPHLLIAGSTGSGKSVCVNSIILSILYKRSPEEVRLILIDPKIVELKLYNDIGHLLAPVITEPKRAFQSLQYCLCEMERRYALLDGMGVRDIKSYNKRIKERNIATERLPYLVVIIDEFADLMATTGKELESTVARLAAMSRAVGIHLVLATQRPSIDVITGLIKANIPTRIAFMVASKMDSRIIIDQVGAEKLLGRGDMLYSSATDPFPVRIQGAFVSEEEVERVVEHVKTLGEPEYIDEEIFVDDEEGEEMEPSLFADGEDPLYDKALEIVLLAGKASASYIQRKLKIGYNRAARLVEDMEARGIVGPANGSKPRDVVHHP